MKFYTEETGSVLNEVCSSFEGISSQEAAERLEKNGKNILFPAIKGVVLKVDIENKKIVVSKSKFDEVAVY